MFGGRVSNPHLRRFLWAGRGIVGDRGKAVRRWAVREPPLQLHDRVASFLEDAEGARAHGHEILIAVADLGLDGGLSEPQDVEASQ